MKIVIDNNIITKDNIDKIKASSIYDLIKKNKIEFFASAMLFNQLIPFLQKIYKQKSLSEVKYYVEFLFELIGNNRIFNSCANISQKELKKRRGKYQFISCAEQKKYKKEMFYDSTLLNIANNSLKEVYCSNSLEEFKKNYKIYTNINDNLIKELKNQSFKNVTKNIRERIAPFNYTEIQQKLVIDIVTNDINKTTLSKKEKKEQIYTKLFELLQEINLLMQLKEENKLITNEEFFRDYYKNYSTPSFTKTMLKTILYGYSYKVIKPEKGYDKDWINDGSYTYFADALLTNDQKFMKDMFENTYGDTKKIFTLDEFITYIKKDLILI